MGLLKPEQTYVRPPYRSLWEREKDRAREMVSRYGLADVAAAVV